LSFCLTKNTLVPKKQKPKEVVVAVPVSSRFGQLRFRRGTSRGVARPGDGCEVTGGTGVLVCFLGFAWRRVLEALTSARAFACVCLEEAYDDLSNPKWGEALR
jgi:hypothetical protein